MNDLIFGEGYDSADLMVIGDYARKFDATSGKCLSGYYKAKINELFNGEFNVDQTYRTCIIKNYIKGLGVGTWAQDKKILEACFETRDLEPQSQYISIIIDEINTIKPIIIIALGEYALRVLTGKEGISKWRGSILPLAEDIKIRLDNFPWEIKVLAAQHPSIIHTAEQEQFILRLDFKKALEILFDQTKRIDYHDINIARSSMDVMRFNEQYPIEKFPRMTYDIESHYGVITCAGYSFDGFRGMTIPLWGHTAIDIVDRARMLYLLSQRLAESEVCNQNLGFDKRVSARFGLFMPNCVWDTMLAQNVIECEFPKNLGFLTSIYTDMSYYKDEGHDFNPSHGFDRLYSYNCKDAISTFQIWNKQIEDLKELDQYDFFTQFVMRLFEMYYDIDSAGIPIDLNKRNELIIKYESLYSLKYLELKAIVGGEINMSSPTQIGKYMETNNFPVLRHRVNSGFMAVNTDVESLKKMRIADPVEYRRCLIPYEMALRFINLVLLLRRINKVIEYINVRIHPWGRVHTSYKIAGTTSGRTSGGQCADRTIEYYRDNKNQLKVSEENLGQSFQTVTKHGFLIEGEDDSDILDGVIGKDVRDMYVTDPGWCLVEADGSQAEARVCDVLGEDYDSLEEYKKFDKHCKVASMIAANPKVFGRIYTYEEIFDLAKRKHDDHGIFMRNIGKHSKHAKNNGMEGYHFATMYLHLPDFKESLRLGKEILATIDKAYPKIEQVFHAQVEFALRNTRTLTGPKVYGVPNGRMRRFFKKIDKHYINVAYSFLPQTTISDHTKSAGLRVRDQISNDWAYLLAENHDSLTGMVKRGHIRKFCSIAKRELERPIDFRSGTLVRDFELIIPAEFSFGRKRWGQMKEIKKFRLVA